MCHLKFWTDFKNVDKFQVQLLQFFTTVLKSGPRSSSFDLIEGDYHGEMLSSAEQHRETV